MTHLHPNVSEYINANLIGRREPNLPSVEIHHLFPSTEDGLKEMDYLYGVYGNNMDVVLCREVFNLHPVIDEEDADTITLVISELCSKWMETYQGYQHL